MKCKRLTEDFHQSREVKDQSIGIAKKKLNQLTPGGVLRNCYWRHQCHFSELYRTPPSQILDPPLAGGSAVDEGRFRSGDGVGRAEPLGPAGADSAGECGSVVQVPTLAAGGGSHPPAARPEAVETSVAEGGGRKRVLPRWLEGYELGR